MLASLVGVPRHARPEPPAGPRLLPAVRRRVQARRHRLRSAATTTWSCASATASTIRCSCRSSRRCRAATRRRGSCRTTRACRAHAGQARRRRPAPDADVDRSVPRLDDDRRRAVLRAPARRPQGGDRPRRSAAHGRSSSTRACAARPSRRRTRAPAIRRCCRGYAGDAEKLDKAIATLAVAAADQVTKDWEALKAAITRGELTAVDPG